MPTSLQSSIVGEFQGSLLPQTQRRIKGLSWTTCILLKDQVLEQCQTDGTCRTELAAEPPFTIPQQPKAGDPTERRAQSSISNDPGALELNVENVYADPPLGVKDVGG